MAAVGVLDAVADEVVEYDAESEVVDADVLLLKLWILLDLVLDLLILHVLLEEVEDLVEFVEHPDLLLVGREFALAYLGHLQDVVRCEDELLEALSYHLTVLFGHLVLAFDQLGHRLVQVYEGVQRREQIMSN